MARITTSNNEAKYEAVLLGLRLAKELSVANLELKCGLQLVASQLRGDFEAKNETMEQYLKLAQSLVARFTQFLVAQVPKSKNRMADALANLASNALYLCHVEASVMNHPYIENTVVHIVGNPAQTS